ncbi:hypothetical protein KXX35_004276 [Aspergillus fumigatus]|nr:hypothetical protein KXX20_008975 [Aspergillus fumigatus]KAH1815300.1 hypothetical protein KXX35_004276 [Aspergillus fumigatus]KAH2139503.1 hypothetical protein KXW66_007270 [Aspergillus fumigatus]
MRSIHLLSFVFGISPVLAWTELHHAPFMNKNIDAIVAPGTYTSHMHTFFGSDAITNVLPTSAELQRGCYSGDNPNDLSVYWVPTLYYVDGDTFTEVAIFRFSTYYTNSYSDSAIPQDFAMISGNASAHSQAEADHPYNGLEWFCEGSSERESDIAKLPTSTCDQHLQLNLLFPQCFNPDDHSEYDFADESNTCPEGMLQMPQLRYRVQYDTKSVAPDGWSGPAPFQLSCSDTPGDGYCFHADFINGWLRTPRRICSSMVVEATKMDPDNGTSDYYTSLEMMDDGAAAGDAVASDATVATGDATSTSVAMETVMTFATQVAIPSTAMGPSASIQAQAPTQLLPLPVPTESGVNRGCHQKFRRNIGHKLKDAAAKRVLGALDARE